ADAGRQCACRAGVRLCPVLPDAHILFGDVEAAKVEVGDTALGRRAQMERADRHPANRLFARSIEAILLDVALLARDEHVERLIARAPIDARAVGLAAAEDCERGHMPKLGELPCSRINAPDSDSGLGLASGPGDRQVR